MTGIYLESKPVRKSKSIPRAQTSAYPYFPKYLKATQVLQIEISMKTKCKNLHLKWAGKHYRGYCIVCS